MSFNLPYVVVTCPERAFTPSSIFVTLSEIPGSSFRIVVTPLRVSLIAGSSFAMDPTSWLMDPISKFIEFRIFLSACQRYVFGVQSILAIRIDARDA